MLKQIKYKSFNHDKSIDELHYGTAKWTSELEFVALESTFLGRLIQSYPYNSTIPNLIENIKSFTQQIAKFEQQQQILIKEIRDHNNQLGGKLECNDLSCDDFYLNEYGELAENIFDYIQNYKILKSEIYKFMSNIIPNS